jgi:pimeloyl-ACP methyl ester carboxylesterase
MGSQPEIASIQRQDGTTIAYDVAGTGPPIVFLHGLTSNRRRWTPVTERLVDSFTCIRIDARGHGESSKADDYGVLTMAADAGAVVSELGIDPPAVVGNSLGGTTAAIFALTQPARAIVIVDQPLRPADSAARIRPLEDRLRGDGFAGAMLEFEEGLGTDPLAGPARAELYAAVRSADRDVVLGVWARLFSSTDEELNAAMAAALPHLQARCLSLHGSQPEEGYAEWLTGHVPHAEVEVWEGMGHFLHLVDPARFARRVRDFVA